MRVLAARLREYATETSVKMFRRKFEAVAADLEEAVSRSDAPFRLAS
jgi:glutaredoxin 2